MEKAKYEHYQAVLHCDKYMSKCRDLLNSSRVKEDQVSKTILELEAKVREYRNHALEHLETIVQLRKGEDFD